MPQRVGLDFIMRGYKMDAKTAQQHGLATEVVPAAQLDSRVAELAQELAELSPATMRLGLEAFYRQELMAFDDAIPYLKEMLDKTLKTADAKEGITAFLEKRKPVWKGC